MKFNPIYDNLRVKKLWLKFNSFRIIGRYLFANLYLKDIVGKFGIDCYINEVI